ncbi:hypothetical protein PIB30_047974 [Stylosanthes scabra]|uniref:ADP-ribosyl cyclase/cyclic ADP-ribose hydrolase n=1 Tax=Stylosanthes scabra TaxID=79078 RepID=A0ABU6RH03_9FABA|nr:hypothetical protein [Stylosanthes scabra]
MASSSSSSSSATFHVPSIKHDMFISFRGKDIRSSFLSHLVKELRHNQIDAYIDERLHRGDEISLALLQAIREAFISLVIFSKHYASSTWCLEELVEIIECMEQHHRIVVPVFYGVDPSDVRHQRGPFGEALDKHQKKLKQNVVKVQSWRSALKKAANLSGFHYPSQYLNESELIEDIVKDVLEKISHVFPSQDNNLVGVDRNLEAIESLLAMKSSDETRILGIWGMGGVGKTTISRAIFEKYSTQYEGCCFLENIREESQKHGLPYLSQKLFSELLKGEHLLLKELTNTSNANIMRRLSRKKVFIVLDDVNTLKQLEHLIGERVRLGQGSRVIVTTRDKHILRNVYAIYEVQKLNFENSLQLFCLNAFNKTSPETGYEKLSEMVVGYANGIPLALKVLGSFLYSRSIEAWESALRKLKVYPNMEVYNVLKLSYDGLDDSEKNIFLDIAFFFKGEDKDDVIRLLDSCGFFAAIGIDTLIRKALVTISRDNRIQMHDLIEQMGWEIVHQESLKDPGRRSRLRNPEDVCNVLKNSKGTNLVEGIILDLSQCRDLHLNADTFKKMPNLRFLKFYASEHQRSSTVFTPTALESFSDELRYLEWSGYPLKSLSSMFSAEKLVELHMPHSQVSKLWDGIQDLVNLKEVVLFSCQQLVELPDFTKATNLEMIDLAFCESLCDVHPSILSIHTLEYLNLHYCRSLKSLKGEIHLEHLENLIVSSCPSLEEFSMSSDEIRELNLRGTRIKVLQSSIGCISNLERFDLSNSRIKSLPNELCSLTSLERLLLSGCKHLMELPHNIKSLSRLKILNIKNCKSLRFIPELPLSITELVATNCTSLETVSNLKEVFTLNKEYISFENCKKLDENSLYEIMEDAYLTMMQAAIRTLLVRRTHLSEKWRASESNGAEFCYPGSKVPEWFRYQTKQASITVELDQPSELLGFIVCCVTSLVPFNKSPHGPDFKYLLLDDGRDKNRNGWSYTSVEELYSDHVNMRYYPSRSDRVLNPRISFEFFTLSDNGYKVEVRPENGRKAEENFAFAAGTPEYACVVKESGMSPVYVSDIKNFIQKMQVELELDDASNKYNGLDELELSTLRSLFSSKMKDDR